MLWSKNAQSNHTLIKNETSEASPEVLSWKTASLQIPTAIAIGATLLLLLITISSFFYLGGFHASAENVNILDAVGSLISGFGGTAALIWMASTFVLQMRELSLQRAELSLQRIAHQNKVIIDFHSIMLESVSSICREFLDVLNNYPEFESEKINIPRLDDIYASGKKDAYFVEILENSKILESMKNQLNIPLQRNIMLYYINRFDSELKKAAQVVSSLSDGNILSVFLRESHTLEVLQNSFNKLSQK